MSPRRLIVAIDGPAGAGKSTVTQGVARRLGYLVLDTGALYRSVALAAEQANISFDDGPRVSEIAETLAARKGIEFVPDASVGQRSPLRQGRH